MRDCTGNRRIGTWALFGCLAAAFSLILVPSALADPPAHARAKALDVTGLNKACGVATDTKGDLYASSAGTDEIKVYGPAPTHTLLTTISNANDPCGLAVTTTGALYASEQATGVVVRYKPDAFPLTGTPLYGPREVIDASGDAEGIAVDPVDDRLYVAEADHVAVYKADGTFEEDVLTGKLTEATGVSAYTHTSISPPMASALNVAVADADADEVKVFFGQSPATLKLRRTISGVDHDDNPETPNQEFGFGAAGAYLAADPGNESAERKCDQVEVPPNGPQACTAGHFFLFDAEHGAVDEFDATGEFLLQFSAAGLEDAGPTQVAVERSAVAGDGTVYVSSGSSAGAQLLAFEPLLMPSREALGTPLSRVLAGARAVATDCRGYVYVAAQTAIYVFSPAGQEITSIETPAQLRDIAADCAGNVYVVEDGTKEDSAPLTYYTPSKYPPDGATTYTRHEPPLLPDEAGIGVGSNSLTAVAVNPANDHVFALGQGSPSFPQVVVEFGSIAEGSPYKGECGAGIIGSARIDIDVYGATGEVYVGRNARTIYELRCGGAPELVHIFKGGGCPSGEIGANPSLAIDQSNGHVVEYANNQAGAAAREYDSAGACLAEFGAFSSASGTAYKVAIDNSCALHDPPLTEQTTPKCKEEFPSDGTAYVAWDTAENEVQPYDVNAFGPLEYPEVEEEEEFALTIDLDGTGTGTVDCKVNAGPVEACSAEYPEGTEIELVPSADPGSEFVEFSGDCGPLSCKLTMNEDKSVTATFDLEPTPEFELKVETDGTGTGTVDCKVNAGPVEACSAEYPEGTEIELVPSADPGSEFVEFSGDCGPANCELTIDEDHIVTVTFDLEPVVPEFPLTVDTEGTGSGTVTSDKGTIGCDPFCSDEYAEGTVVVLTATPAPGSIFVSWKYCDSGGVNGRQCTVTMTKAKTVKATFTTTHALEVSKAPGSGLGKVQSSPGGVLCLSNCSETTAAFKEGTKVTLKQTPAKHFHFVEWLGDCTGSGACEPTMGEDHSVEAKFAEDAKHLLTLTKSGGGQGTVKSSVAGINCGAVCSAQSSAYYQGEVVELTATPGKGSSFGGWSGAGCSGTGACTVTMSEAKAVQAEFK